MHTVVMRRRILQTTIMLIAVILISTIFSDGSAKLVVESTSATSSVAAVETTEVVQPAADTYPVTKVVDGDTLTVEMNGKSVKIRLIGLDTPETVDPRKPVQCFGKEASERARQMLSGQNVRVEKDASQGEYDKYGRLLAYVYLPDLPAPASAGGQAGGTLFNKYMIASGYAHEYTYNLPYKFQKEFKAAEVQAREMKKGLWADGVCS